MSYKEQLRAAHTATLKQKYLDAIAKAQQEAAQQTAANDEQARELYITRKTAERDLPQQLRARGLSGGAQLEDMRGVLEEYKAKYDELRLRQQQLSSQLAAEIEKQQRLMSLAIEEYNLKNAAADESAEQSAKKSSSGGSASRAGSAAKSTSSSKSSGTQRGTLVSQTAGAKGSTARRSSQYSGGGHGGGVR